MGLFQIEPIKILVSLKPLFLAKDSLKPLFLAKDSLEPLFLAKDSLDKVFVALTRAQGPSPDLFQTPLFLVKVGLVNTRSTKTCKSL